MAIRTRLATGYWVRKLVLVALFAGFGVFALYDAYERYPAQMERFQAWQRYQELSLKADSEAGVSSAEANEMARLLEEHHLGGANQPQERSQLDITLQKILAAICFPIALAIGATWLISARRRYVYHDDGALEAPEGKIAPGRMTGLDKTRWQSKSIALLEVDGGPKGGGRGVRLDAWIYDGMESIIERLDRRFHPEEYRTDDTAAATATAEKSAETADGGA